MFFSRSPKCSTKDAHISKENDRARDLPVTLQFQNLYEITVLPQFSFLFVISPFLLQICFFMEFLNIFFLFFVTVLLLFRDIFSLRGRAH